MDPSDSIAANAPVAIYGAGGLGRELLQVLHDMGTPCAGFVVDAAHAAPDAIHGIAVHRSVTLLATDPAIRFVIAIGNPASRARIADAVEALIGPRFATIIHPRAWIGQSVAIGAGSMVFGSASVTADARLGRHVLVNPGCTIAHDCVLEDFATLGPSCALAGGVVIAQGAELGIGARVAPQVRIGQGAMVGAGAVCIHLVAARTTVAGVPARLLDQDNTRQQEAGRP